MIREFSLVIAALERAADVSRGRMFGSEGLKLESRVFAMEVKGRLVVKLSVERAEEAGIAAEHCSARSFADTRWSEIADLYAMLERIDPSPFHTLNRAVAVTAAEGAQAGLVILDGVVPPAWLRGHYLWDAVLADLHRRAGHAAAAETHRERALAAAPLGPVRRALERRLGRPAT